MNIKHISSTANESIKAVTALHQTKHRAEQKKFIAEGIRVIDTLLASGLHLDQLYVVNLESAETLNTPIEDNQITTVTHAVMNKISTATTPSGMLAVFEQPEAPDIKSLGEGIVLAEIADPGNMGTLMRSAAAMGKATVVLIDGADAWSPKVVQASAGTIGKLSIFNLTWQELVAAAKTNSLNLIALVVDQGKRPDQLNFANSLLVVGNEARGLSEEWIADCNDKITIPMPGKIESLNAAIAGSIALYLAYEHRS